MNNLERFINWKKNNKNNKILNTIDINKKIFKKIYPIKNTPWLDYLSFHVSDKNKIIKQFKKNKDLISLLDENLPTGNILYIDYMEVNPRNRSNGLWKKVVEKIIKISKEIKLKGIYLDSYKCSMNFWENNWFSVDQYEQKEINNEKSNYHSAFLLL